MNTVATNRAAAAGGTRSTRFVAGGLRAVGAALLAGIAAIHLHLWASGYRHVALIGPSFLLAGIAGAILVFAVLLVPWRGVAALLGAGLCAGTLIGAILSLTVGILGFREYPGAPFLTLSMVLEAAGTVALGALVLMAAHHRR
jgi:hypothetical protein